MGNKDHVRIFKLAKDGKKSDICFRLIQDIQTRPVTFTVYVSI